MYIEGHSSGYSGSYSSGSTSSYSTPSYESDPEPEPAPAAPAKPDWDQQLGEAVDHVQKAIDQYNDQRHQGDYYVRDQAAANAREAVQKLNAAVSSAAHDPNNYNGPAPAQLASAAASLTQAVATIDKTMQDPPRGLSAGYMPEAEAVVSELERAQQQLQLAQG